MPIIETQGTQFTHSVEKIAERLLGLRSHTRDLPVLPHLREKLPYLHIAITEVEHFRREPNPLKLPEMAIQKLCDYLGGEHEAYSRSVVPEIVAIAILTGDKTLQDFSDLQKRFLLDLALNVPLIYYQTIYTRGRVTIPYLEDPNANRALSGQNDIFKIRIISYSGFQDKLREKHSPSKGKEI